MSIKKIKEALAALPDYVSHNWRVMNFSPDQAYDKWFVSGAVEGWEPAPLCGYSGIGVWDHKGYTNKEIAEFIAACDPATIAAMIEKIENYET